MLNSAPAGVAGQHRQVSPVLDLVAGSAAGAMAVLLTYPLDLVCQCSLMATSPWKLRRTARLLVQARGKYALLTGLLMTFIS